MTFENTVNSGTEVRRLDFGSVPSILDSSPDKQSCRLPGRSQSGKINSKRLKVDVLEKYAKKKDSVSKLACFLKLAIVYSILEIF